MTITAGVVGATGYTGLELVRLLHAHPHVQLVFATSEREAGSSLAASHPQAPDITLQRADDAPFEAAEHVFLCLPHTLSAPTAVRARAAGARVVDLSADLRFGDAAVYEQWYHTAHPDPSLLPVPYGLPELGREALHGASIVANPGCYATAMLLSLAPLAEYLSGPVIVDAKSGVTGAGRSAKRRLLFAEVQNNLSPYSIGRVHRHVGEVEQVLSGYGVQPGSLVFTPHLLPTNRGILAAVYAPVADSSAAAEAIRAAYADEPLIRVLPGGQLATLAHAVRTPFAVMSLTEATPALLIVMTAIDNLLKGAASQAVQNFNLMWGLPETLGLLPAVEVRA